MDQKVVTIKELAKRLDVARSSLYNWLSKNDLEYFNAKLMLHTARLYRAISLDEFTLHVNSMVYPITKHTLA